MNGKKWIAILLILCLCAGIAIAGDTKKADDKVVKDDKVIDKTKETTKEIKNSSIPGIKVTDTSAASYSVTKQSETVIKIKKQEAKGEHTKTIVSFPKSELDKIDVDHDNLFGYIRFDDNGNIVEQKTVASSELVSGCVMTFSETIIDGYSGSYTKAGTSQNVSQSFAEGQSFPSNKTSAVSLNISTTAYSDPYSEIAAMLNITSWHKFDGNATQRKIDSTGNGHAAVSVGTPIYTTGKYNNGTKYPTGTNYFYIPHSSSYNTSNGFVSVWFMIYSTSGTQNIIEKVNTNAASAGLSLDVYLTKLESRVQTSSTIIGPTPAINVWHNVIQTRNGARQYMYYDGVLYNSASYSIAPYTNGSIIIGGRKLTGAYQFPLNGTVDSILIGSDNISALQAQAIYRDGLQQLQAKTNANSTYSTMWNSSSNNPLTLPVSSLDGLISSIQFKVPVNVTQNGINIYYYNQTAAPFTPTSTIYFTEDTTLISDSHTGTLQTVNISHTSLHTAQDGTLIPYEVLPEYYGTLDFDTNNANSTSSRNATHFIIDTGYVKTNTTYNYSIGIPNYIEEMTWSEWNPNNATCSVKVQIANSTPYTSWNFTTTNISNGNVYSLVYPGNQTVISNATASNGQVSILATGIPDGVYWIAGYVNGEFGHPGTEVIIIGVAGAFVGASFINTWYRKRRKLN